MGKKDKILKVKRLKAGQSKNTDKEEEFTIESVLELGGSKEDFALLAELNDEVEIFGNSEDFDADPIKKDEIRKFIAELGIREYTPKEDIEEESSKSQDDKLDSSESKTKKQDNLDGNDTSSGDNTVTKQKKLKKNKFKIQDDEISSSGLPESIAEKSTDGNVEKAKPIDLDFANSIPPSRSYLLVKPSGKWFSINECEKRNNDSLPSDDAVKKLKEYCETLITNEVELFKKKQDNNKSSDAKWIRTVLKSGTLSDKTAALTLMIQESPVHNLHSLDLLINMVKKKSHREALTALETVKELWISELLPDDRKLNKFEDNPILHIKELASGNKDTRDKKLMIWYFEDQLKQKYEVFIRTLKAMTQDPLTATKKKSLDAVCMMLVKKPEQERLLLETVVNKLGDPENKIATQAAHLLSKLVAEHPRMKFVVSSEVERLLYRNNVSQKAQYFAVCYLNQLMLNKSEKDLAAKLIGIYFSFFKVFSEKKKKVETKMLSALLTGVNRAFPYAKVNIKTLETELKNLYKTVHVSQFNTGVQALMLLFHVVDSSDSLMCDRYFSALYRKLLDPELQTSSRQAMFLNLLFKSLKKDDSDPRIKAFIKRLLQQCCHMPSTFVCGSLVLLSELLKLKPKLLDIGNINKKIQEDIDRGDLFDSDDEHFTDIKDDSDEERDSSEDESHEQEVEIALSEKGHTTAGPTWVHRKNMGNEDKPQDYNPFYRNPMYCNADRECVWELRKLVKHYHPTVILFADTLLQGKKIEYTGNPLQDFSLIRFLDRFVYRNPKKLVKNIDNALDPRSKAVKLKGIRAMAVNDEKFVEMDESNVPVEEKFFHKYFKHQAEKKKDTMTDDYDSDAESVGDEEFDDFLDKFENQIDGGLEDIQFDFAGEMGKQGKAISDYVDSESDDDFGDLSDEEVDFGDDFKMAEDFGDGEGDEGEWSDDSDQNEDDQDEDMDDSDDMEEGQDPGFDEEDIAFSDEDEQVVKTDFSMKSKRKNTEKTSGKKKKKVSSGGLFAAAEEFAHIIDENADSKFDLAGTEAMSNTDNAHFKQLDWESKRDKSLKGKTWKTKPVKGKKHGGGNKTSYTSGKQKAPTKRKAHGKHTVKHQKKQKRK